MKRKNFHKTHRKKAVFTQNQIAFYSMFAGISLVLLFIFVVSTQESRAERKVLGMTNGPVLLAKGGDDDEHENSGDNDGSTSHEGSDNDGSSSINSESNESSNTSSSSQDSSTDNNGSSTISTGESNSSPVSNNTSVICTGPDNKQFQTDYEHCSKLNKEWNHQIIFTVLNKPKKKAIEEKIEGSPLEQEKEVEKESPEKMESSNDGLEVETEDNKTRIDIRKIGTKVRVKIEDGKTIIQAKQENEDEVELEELDGLEKVNEALKDSDVEIRKTEQNTIAIRNGEVEAETHLPLSVDPLTHELTIETEAGEKKVYFLPEQAIQNILLKKLITNVETETLADLQEKTEHIQKAELTELNGEAIFKVQGVLNKKLFGLFEIALPKTILSSAETGEIIKVDESFTSKLLELVSF